MSKKNGRRVFSKKDGTSFIEDVNDIKDELITFVNGLPPKIKKWLAEAETIVELLEKLEELLENETFEKAMEFLFAQIKGERDREIFEAIKQAIINMNDVIDGWLDKFDTAGETLKILSEGDLSQIEADLTTQVAVYAYKG